MLKGFFLTFLLLAVLTVAVLGFRGSKSTAPPLEAFPDMVRQPKVRPQAPLDFFADNRGMRPPVPGTVPMGYEMPAAQAPANVGVPPAPAGQDPAVVHDLAFSAGAGYANSGRMGGNWGTGIPMPVNAQFMERGAERFMINCAICHGPTGAGDGIVKSYGMATIVSIIDDRITNMSDGEIFHVITHGRNTMMSYGGTITVNDRWAIVAYLRALQRRERATVADIPPEARVELEKQ